jgi:putative lipoprotein
MKRLFSLLAAVMFCTSVMAQAVIKFEKTSLDFGKFRESKVQVGEFVFTNTGNKPLVIQQAFGSCGCTVATPPKAPIAPGAKGVIKVSYNGRGKFQGEFKKPITVRSNASNSIVRIYILGNMLVDE